MGRREDAVIRWWRACSTGKGGWGRWSEGRGVSPCRCCDANRLEGAGSVWLRRAGRDRERRCNELERKECMDSFAGLKPKELFWTGQVVYVLGCPGCLGRNRILSLQEAVLGRTLSQWHHPVVEFVPSIRQGAGRRVTTWVQAALAISTSSLHTRSALEKRRTKKKARVDEVRCDDTARSRRLRVVRAGKRGLDGESLVFLRCRGEARRNWSQCSVTVTRRPTADNRGVDSGQWIWMDRAGDKGRQGRPSSSQKSGPGRQAAISNLA